MGHPAPRILIADDQADVLEALRLLFKAEGLKTETVSSPEQVVSVLKTTDFDLLLMDLNYARDTTSGQEGLELLGKVQALDSSLPVVVMTAWSTVDLAVEAMRRGAKDFLQKPWENQRVLAIVRTQLALRDALRRSEQLEAERTSGPGLGTSPLIAASSVMRPVLEMIDRVGPSDANVLITGENGSGKSLVAKALQARSPRAAKPFVSVNVGGLPEGLFESELFGHVKGAFTDAKTDRVGRFELADGGTLFLDEIGNVSPAQQSRLLRVIESKEFERVGSSKTRQVDTRLISATNADLQAEVAAGRFRQDLFFRLNTVTIHLPPLRERTEDIPALAQAFLATHARKYRKAIQDFDGNALAVLKSHGWPGNVRELDHAVERAVLMARDSMIRSTDLGLSTTESTPPLSEMDLEEVERFLIKKALARFDGNAKKAADALGLSRSAFYRRLEKYGL